MTRADFLLPGFVDTHLHYPQVHATAAYGGGQLLHWLDHCIFPTEARLADEELAARAAARLRRAPDRRRDDDGAGLRLGLPRRAGRAVPRRTPRPGSGWSAAGASRPSGPPSAGPLLTGEDEALALVADEIDRWHGRDADLTAADDAEPGPAPGRGRARASPCRSRRQTLRGLGELYAERPDERRLLPHPPQRERPPRRRRGRRRPRRCTRSTATSTRTTAASSPARGPAARRCSAGGASSPTPCTAPTPSSPGWPRRGARSPTARRRSSSSAPAPCRGGARRRRA